MKVGIAQCDVIPSANKKLTERDVFANFENNRSFFSKLQILLASVNNVHKGNKINAGNNYRFIALFKGKKWTLFRKPVIKYYGLS